MSHEIAVPLPKEYPRFLDPLKERIRTVRLKAPLSANQELIALYWHIGGSILERPDREGWSFVHSPQTLTQPLECASLGALRGIHQGRLQERRA